MPQPKHKSSSSSSFKLHSLIIDGCATRSFIRLHVNLNCNVYTHNTHNRKFDERIAWHTEWSRSETECSLCVCCSLALSTPNTNSDSIQIHLFHIFHHVLLLLPHFRAEKMKRHQRLFHLLLSHVHILYGTCAIRATLNVYIFIDVDSDVFIPDYVTSIYLLCYQPETNKLPRSCELATLRLCVLVCTVISVLRLSQ